MDTKPTILICGEIVWATQEIEQLKRIANILVNSSPLKTAASTDHHKQTVTPKNRKEFIEACKNGPYSHLDMIYHSNHSLPTLGNFDTELISHLPKSLRFICHNGAGYDMIDAKACFNRGIIPPYYNLGYTDVG